MRNTSRQIFSYLMATLLVMLSSYVTAAVDVTVSLTSSANPVPSRSPVTYTATVKAVNPADGPVTGVVNIVINSFEESFQANLDANGVGTYTTNSFVYGDTSRDSAIVSAEFFADELFNGGTDSLLQTTQPAVSTTQITSVSATEVSPGQPVTVNFSVSSFETLSGIVSISDGVDTCLASVSSGSCSITLNSSGPRTLVASYASDVSHVNGSQSAGVVINVVPPAPTLADDSFTVVEDTVATLDVLTNDTNASGLTISALSTPDKGGTVIGVGENQVTYSPLANFFGTETFTYEAMTAAGGKAVATVVVQVTPQNDAPVINKLPLASILVGVPYADKVTAQDFDGDTLAYSAVNLPTWLTLNSSTGALSGTPAKADVGVASITFIVSDGIYDVEKSLELTVASGNSLPEFVALESLLASVGTPFSYKVSAVDADGDELSYTAEGFPGSFVFDGASGTLTGTPSAADAGSFVVVFAVSDGVDTAIRSVDLVVRAENQAPVIVSQAPVSAGPGVAYSYQLSATDADNDALSYAAVSLPSWLSFNPETRTLSGTPTSSDVGAQNVTLAVSDGFVSVNQTFLLNVSLDNEAPIITSTPNDRAITGSLFSYQLTATDADGDLLTYSASSLPSWLTFSAASGELSGTPAAANEGQSTITLMVSDSHTTVVQTFTLVVSPPLYADISVALAASANPVRLGETMQLTANVRNEGTLDTSEALVVLSIVGDAVVTPAAECALTNNDGLLNEYSCAVPAQEVGALSSLIFSVDAESPGDINVSTSVAMVDDYFSDNNSDDIKLTATADIMDAVEVEIGQGGSAVLVGDLNGDQLTDLVMLGAKASGIEVYLKQGDVWVLSQSIGDADTSIVGGALADFTGEGILDMVVVRTQGQANKVYANDGAGQFTQIAALGASDSYDVAAADLNGDSQADLVFANNGPNTVYIKTAGTFELTDQLGNSDSRGVAVGDLDGDGLPEIVFANTDAASEIFNNTELAGGKNGASVVAGGEDVLRQVSRSGYQRKAAASGALPGAEASSDYDVAIIDFDRNGTNDLIFASGIKKQISITDELGNPLYQNDGAGNFTQTKRLGNADSRSLAVFDADNDGWTDIVSFNQNGVHQLYRNFDSQFAVHGAVFDLPGTTGGAVGNFDGKGFDDIIFVSSESGNPILLNRLHESLEDGDAKWFGDLQVNMSVELVSSQVMAVGGNQVVIVNLANNGERTATSVVLESSLDDGLAIQSVKISKGTCEVFTGNGLAQCRIDVVDVGEQVSLQFVVRATDAGEKKIAAAAASSRSDSRPGDNLGSQTVSVTSYTAGGGGSGGGGSIAPWMLLVLAGWYGLSLFRRSNY
ncbi:MAG: tandem-95 repeat protein [Hahellaceae bacterium]|nr:tandem-95 repeat protein [Hahellaceae bacterium]